MRSLLLTPAFVILALLGWGLFGPAMHHAQAQLGDGARAGILRPLIGFGSAHCLIAVILPIAALRINGDRGRWTATGVVWSFLGGLAGACGALAIAVSFWFHGQPTYVMPWVFGLAAVVNTFAALWTSKAGRHASPLFFAGVILVAVGTICLWVFTPDSSPAVHEPSEAVERSATQPAMAAHERDAGSAMAAQPTQDNGRASILEKLTLLPLSIGLAVLCWGGCGPLLDKGYSRMDHSRWRPLLCAGVAHVLIVTVVPFLLLPFYGERSGPWFTGAMWSLASGVAAASGILGVLMAFSFGARAISVMPLVFGGAVIVSAFAMIVVQGISAELSPWFPASLIVVVAGAVAVLLFAPRDARPDADTKPAAPPPPRSERQPTTSGDATRTECRNPELDGVVEAVEDTVELDETFYTGCEQKMRSDPGLEPDASDRNASDPPLPDQRTPDL